MDKGVDVGFDSYVRDARRGLVRQAYSLCRNWHEAEDLVQVALWSLFRRWDRLDDRTRLHAYTGQIVLNAYLAKRRKRQATDEILTWAPPEQFDRSPVESRLDDRLVLVSALQQLPPSQQKVITLRFWADLSVRQTATILGCSVGNVTSQTTRAVRSLRLALGVGL